MNTEDVYWDNNYLYLKIKDEKRELGRKVDNKFVTTRTPKHIYRKENSFGICYDAIPHLIGKNIKTIYFKYKSITGEKIYTVSLTEFVENGFMVQEQGWEEQLHYHIKNLERFR